MTLRIGSRQVVYPAPSDPTWPPLFKRHGQRFQFRTTTVPVMWVYSHSPPGRAQRKSDSGEILVIFHPLLPPFFSTILEGGWVIPWWIDYGIIGAGDRPKKMTWDCYRMRRWKFTFHSIIFRKLIYVSPQPTKALNRRSMGSSKGLILLLIVMSIVIITNFIWYFYFYFFL